MRTKAINEQPSGRTDRVPVGRRNILTVKGKEPGFVYRIVNDDGDNVERLLAAGYVIEDADKITVGDSRITKTHAPGTKAEVNVGKGTKAFVMKQRDEFYQEDQQSKQASIRELEDSSKKNALGASDFGDFDTKKLR